MLVEMKRLASDLLTRLESRNATTAVIGLGYVGLPLLVEFARAGFCALGIDVDRAKVEAVRRGESYIPDVPESDVSRGRRAQANCARRPTSRPFADADTINICVPTPLRKTKDPDISFVVAAVEQMAKHLRPGQLVILESTTYPGTTDEVLQPMLEANGLKAGKDFFLAFSPERVDPGNAQWKTRNIPKVVGGIDSDSTAVAGCPLSPDRGHDRPGLVDPGRRDGQAAREHVPGGQHRAGERAGADVPQPGHRRLGSHRRGQDEAVRVHAVLSRARASAGTASRSIRSTCRWKARQNGFETPLHRAGGRTINAGMPRFVVERIADALNSVAKPLRGSRVHLFGIAYKADVNDVRESPAIDVAHLLRRSGATVSYSDPFVPRLDHGDLDLEAVPADRALAEGIDCAVITTNHTMFDYDAIVAKSPLVVDTRNALNGTHASHVFRL